MGRKRLWDSEADRHRAKRDRTRILLDDLAELREALADACQAGRSEQLVNHLPEHPNEWVPVLARRLVEKKLVVCRRDKKPREL